MKEKERKILVGIIFCLLVCSFLPLKAKSETPQSPEPTISQLLATLPKESNDSQSGCATLKILETLRENRLKSEAKTESTTSYSTRRPTDEYGNELDWKQHLLPQIYITAHSIIHWTNGLDGGNLTDAVSLNDTNTNGVPDYVENCAESFETSWEIEVTNRTFPAPPSDENVTNDEQNRNPDARYDIFIYHTPPGYLAYAYPEQYPTSPSFSYIGLRNNLEPLETMQAIAAHEFFHAIQFVYDCTEESWWMEASAVYMEDEVFSDSNFNYRYIDEWFDLCGWLGLEYDDPYYTWHKYGTFIWAKRMSEDFGDGIIKDIWFEMNQQNGTNGLEAIENVLLSKGSTLLAEFSRFLTGNFFLEDYYQDGAEYRDYLTGKTAFDGVYIEYEYNASNAPNSIEITDTLRPQLDKWATDYITLQLDPAKLKYRISFSGLNITTDYLVKLVTKKEGNFSETVFTLNAQKNGYVDLDYDAFNNVTLVLANVGNAYATRPAWKVTITVISPIYDVAITNVESSTYLAFPNETVNINVTVRNNGNMMTSFNVQTWWGELLLATKSATSLAPDSQKILTIYWTIPAGTNGSEMVCANATVIPGDIDPDNNRFEDDELEIRIPVHNLTIGDITVPKHQVGQEMGMNITIAVLNQGNFPETINVTLYFNGTIINDGSYLINPGTEREIDFPVLITSEANLYQNYTLEIQVDWILDEETLGSKTSLDWIMVTLPGDIDADKDVDIFDVVIAASDYSLSQGDAGYNPESDIDGDGDIDIYDIVILCNHYGETYP